MGKGGFGVGLEERYPEIAFLTTTLVNEIRDTKWEKWEEPLLLEDAQVLYVYGVTPHFEILLEWLEQDPARDVVFLEDDLTRVAQLIRENKDVLFQNQRLHLRICLPEESLETFIEAVVRDFPTEAVACISGKGDKEKFAQLRLLILRKSVVEAAVAAELLYYPRLFRNLRENFPLLARAFDVGKWKGALAGMPAVICGAGPSLSYLKEELDKIQGKGVIFAGGSAIAALSSMHLSADLLFAIDPNSEELSRLALHTIFDAPLIYGHRLHPGVLQASVSELGYLVSGTGGSIETWMEEELGIEDPEILQGLSQEALSVTAVAVQCALAFGCNPIIFAGVDLCYDNGSRYTQGVIPDMQCALEEKGMLASETPMECEEKITLAKWIMERDVLQQIIAQHKEVQFYNASMKGLIIEGALPLHDWKTVPFKACDVRGKIHELVQASRFSLKEETIEEKIQQLQKSFARCQVILKEMIAEVESLDQPGETREETPKEGIFEMDLEEEIAYQVALRGAVYAWTFPLQKIVRRQQCRRPYWELKRQLYRKMHSLVEEYGEIC